MQGRSPANDFRIQIGLALGAALVLAAAPAEAQLRSAAAAEVTLVAVAAPRMSFDAVSAPAVRTEAGYSLDTRSISVSANVPYTLAVTLARRASDAASVVEVLDRSGRWVALRHGDRVTLAEGGPERGTHRVECRVAAPAQGSPADCDVSFELVSTHPQFPMRVTAFPGLLVAQRL